MAKDLKRKKLKKLAARISIEDIEADLKAWGGDWVFLNRSDGSPDLIQIHDNYVFKRFEQLMRLDGDEVFETAKYNYLEKKGLRLFNDFDELQKYVDTLTLEKYGAQSQALITSLNQDKQSDAQA